MLHAALVKRYDAFQLETELQVEDGGIVVLVGESGAGKSTVLRLLAGLEEPDAGRIAVDGRTWFDARAGVSLASWRREVRSRRSRAPSGEETASSPGQPTRPNVRRVDTRRRTPC